MVNLVDLSATFSCMPSTKAKKTTAVAFQASTNDGLKAVVGIGNLRVLLLNDDGSWFAQGLEIDYAAQGATLEEVKRRFQDGLMGTVSEHLRMYGDIGKLLQPAPSEIWQKIVQPQCQRQTFTQISFHQIGQVSRHVSSALPFEGISFIQQEAA